SVPGVVPRPVPGAMPLPVTLGVTRPPAVTIWSYDPLSELSGPVSVELGCQPRSLPLKLATGPPPRRVKGETEPLDTQPGSVSRASTTVTSLTGPEAWKNWPAPLPVLIRCAVPRGTVHPVCVAAP